MKDLSREIISLIVKDLRLEWRQKAHLNSLLLYVCSTVFICYLSFAQKRIALQPLTWNTLFWIILLFTAIHTISKSFTQEGEGQHYFYFQLVSPQAIIVSKMLYNAFLMLVMIGMGYLVYSLVLGNPVNDQPLYLLTLFLGGISFSTSLTLVAAIASRAKNNATLMAVLGFPVILPVVLMLIKVSKNALDGLNRSASTDELITLLGLNVIVVAASLLLFPFLWRS